MKILRNQSIVDTMAANIVKGELSNIAAVLAVPQVITTYYSIDAEYSQTVKGYQNIHDFISADSTVAFNKVTNMPMAGIDNLLITNEFNDDTGIDVDFESDALILPKTVNPKHNDFFTVSGMLHPTLFVVTDVQQTLVRSNPFVQIHFKLAHMGQDWIDQINRQVLKTYTCRVSSLGADKSLVIESGNASALDKHIQNYLDVASMYTYTYYDRSRAAFVYDGMYCESTKSRMCLIDMVIWRLMYDMGIIVYDELLAYAASNMNVRINKVFVDKPILVNDYRFKNSIIYRILENNHSRTLNEFPYPMFYEENSQMTKYQGVKVVYVEGYDETAWCKCEKELREFMPFDADQLIRMVNNQPYARDEIDGWSLRNALISYYNEEPIDFESIEITDRKSLLNYYYVPIILGIYKNYIIQLANGTISEDSTKGSSGKPVASRNDLVVNDDLVFSASQQAKQTLFNLTNGLSSSNIDKNNYNNPLGGII